MAPDIKERTKKFAVEVVKVTAKFPKTSAGWKIGDQLIGSATSIAANTREANSSRTRREFISKMGIALQEADETMLWLEIIKELSWLPIEVAKSLLQEAHEITKILARIILNTKKNERNSS